MYVLKISFLTIFPSDSEQKPCHKQRENGRVVGKWHPLKKIGIEKNHIVMCSESNLFFHIGGFSDNSGPKWQKKGFLEHFCCQRYQFPDHKIRFFSLF